MSERLSPQHESQGEQEKLSSEHQEKLDQKIEKEARQSKHEHADNIHEIRSKVEKEAKAKHEHTAKKESESKEADQPLLVGSDLKQAAYRRTLKKTQAQLSPPARAFSKVIHQPVVENISEFAGKTVARPSGILLGGIFSFLGSSIFLWVAKHYGYEYNFLLFAVFFVGGFFIGLLVELGLFAANRKK